MNGADLAVLVVPFLDGSSNRVEAGTDLDVVICYLSELVSFCATFKSVVYVNGITIFVVVGAYLSFGLNVGFWIYR